MCLTSRGVFFCPRMVISGGRQGESTTNSCTWAVLLPTGLAATTSTYSSAVLNYIWDNGSEVVRFANINQFEMIINIIQLQKQSTKIIPVKSVLHNGFFSGERVTIAKFPAVHCITSGVMIGQKLHLLTSHSIFGQQIDCQIIDGLNHV